MSTESFWGVTLSKYKKEYKMSDISDEAAKILLKKVILDKPGDSDTVVEVTTELYNEDSFKFNLSRLKKNTSEQHWDSFFPAEKTTFKLVEGDGPVTLVGALIIGYDAPYEMDSDDSAEEEDEDEDVDEDMDQSAVDDLRSKLNARKPGQKSKLAKNGDASKIQLKKAKMEEENDDDDDDDDEDEDVSDDEVQVPQPSKKSSKPNVQAKDNVSKGNANGNQNKKPMKQAVAGKKK